MILIFGTSITYGKWDEKGGWAQRIKSFADKKTLQSNYEEYNPVYNLGLSGENSNGLVKRIDAEISSRLKEVKKLKVVIETGINDSYYIENEHRHSVEPEIFQENIKEIIKTCRKYNAEIIFLGLTPIDERVNPVPWRPEIYFTIEFVKKYDEILKKVCADSDVSYIELLSKFKTEDSKNFLEDGLHPNTKGHEIIYNEVLAFLKSQNFI